MTKEQIKFFEGFVQGVVDAFAALSQNSKSIKDMSKDILMFEIDANRVYFFTNKEYEIIKATEYNDAEIDIVRKDVFIQPLTLPLEILSQRIITFLIEYEG